MFQGGITPRISPRTGMSMLASEPAWSPTISDERSEPV